MTIEEAIKTAIEFETRVLETYADAAGTSKGDAAARFFRMMADEEKEHVTYLQGKLRQWRRTGKVTPGKLETALPSPAEIAEKTARMEKAAAKPAGDARMDLLRKALEVENTAFGFYSKMISELPEEGRILFARFAEIEEGHVAMVQAEMNYVGNFGVWFDVQEFQL